MNFPPPTPALRRIVPSTGLFSRRRRWGNLLYPSDSRLVHLSVRTLEQLPEASRFVTFSITDYWSAEQMKPVQVALKDAPRQKDFFCYEGSVDLAGVPLKQGKVL